MTHIIYYALKELILSLLGRIGWKAIGERLFTRLVMYGLKKLEAMSTNTVVVETIQDIVRSLDGKGLKALNG